ncbi:DUF6233 domain-containing protein [Streptomyces albogriseolus]|uniref:DUF6233 domain-containing protein n=1 Tax=Streptomyces albogriseolus TaxID=1887 RepID=UPI0033A79720
MDHEHRIKNVFDDLPPDLDRLHTLRVWHTMWLQRIDAKIAALTRRQTEEERARRNRPAPPEWIVELGIGERRPPLQVHTGDCHTAGTRHRPVDQGEARRLLATGLTACGHCRPDSCSASPTYPASQPPLPPRHTDRTLTPSGRYSASGRYAPIAPEQDPS